MTVFKRLITGLSLASTLWPGLVLGAQPAPLTDARRLYNEGRYAEAIDLAESAQAVAANAEVARLIAARARLERFRHASAAEDLDVARSALLAIDATRLSARDRAEMLVGFGEALFLEGTFGAAAEMFALGLDRADDLGPGTYDVLLDWWASAMDRAAQATPPEARAAAYQRLEDTMRLAAERDPASSIAAYWVAAAARARGDAGRAWAAALAAWIRAPLTREGGASLRLDLDRLVTEAIVPERARKEASPSEIDRASAELLAEWERFKTRWSAAR